ncbi:MAG TPA: 5'/3'-nucleotidase SurE [Thermodesulfovibrionales bacterium]|nr:5'/3'-nucleotidase SurE [Thermodesulfovibrionales bacterium]
MALILVTNDDGVHSSGIMALHRAMKELGDVYIVAPDRERSAAGHSLTLHRPLKAEEISERVISVNGTPTDCVTLGINKLLPRKPDLVVSGINKGANLGDDITYSGTVSAAIEGTIFGIPSIAFSLIADRHYHFDTATFFATRIASYALEQSLPFDTLLNVNFPNIPREGIRGIKITRQGKRIYENSIQETFNPWGEKYYWIGGGRTFWEHGDEADMEAVQQNYVSITPIHLDLTNHGALSFLRERWDVSGMMEGGDEKL